MSFNQIILCIVISQNCSPKHWKTSIYAIFQTLLASNVIFTSLLLYNCCKKTCTTKSLNALLID
jgi:hypothetical protein